MLLFVQQLIIKDNNNMKRDSRITADVTEPTHDLLRAACLKYDSSKGKLLEKMIIRFCSEEPDKIETTTAKGEMNTVKRSKPRKAASYPSNLDDQFEMLWDTKGKRGAKMGTKGAYEIFKKLAANVDDEACETFTRMCMDDILKCSGEPGYPEMHLTSYLNQQRWVK